VISSSSCTGSPGGAAIGAAPPQPTTADAVRRLSPQALEQLGRDSLRQHLLAQALVAHLRHGPIGADNLDSLLHDDASVRHPVRLVFELGEMAGHQFGQPDHDWRDPSGLGRVLYLRPELKDRPELVPAAVAYLLPVINFGEVVSDDDCLEYGATLLGLTQDEYYARLCHIAAFVGAEERHAGESDDREDSPAGGLCQIR